MQTYSNANENKDKSFAYDTMGRLWGDKRTTNSITKNASYLYNLDGSLNTLTYPSGHSVYSAVGGAGLPLTANDSAVVAYVSSAMYTAWGAHTYSSLGLKMSESILYNQRLQPCWTYGPQNLTATSCTASYVTGTYIDLKYNFNLGADNGNLAGITNDRNANRSQVYGFDAVNRVASAATASGCTASCWSLTFGLDQWANLKTATATGIATPVSLSVGTNNQITTGPFTYDASGNETADATSTYVWNAESEIKTGGGVTYLYDGRGKRVEKSGTKLYWYGGSGEVLDETDTTGSTANTTFSEYVYFDGARAARRDYLNNVYYYFEDQVKSSRVIAEIPAGSTTPTLCYDADFYPYGGEIDFTNACAQNYKFQGKERDTETNNDYFGARFYSSTYGRFLSPDWSSTPAPVPYANLTNPQTLNLYSFVADNPESFSDLNGHAGGCVSVMVSGSEDCNSPNNGSGVFGRFGVFGHPRDPGCPAQGPTCSSTWQKISLWGKLKSWFSSPGSDGGSPWFSVFKLASLRRLWPSTPNPSVAVGADVVGLASALSRKTPLGVVSAGVSLANDHSAPNVAMTAASFLPEAGMPVAFIGVEADLLNFEVQTAGEGMIQGIPGDTMNDGYGHTIPNPANFDMHDAFK
jgi:RHS repeat-associated protein